MVGGQRSFLRHIETLFDAGAIGEQSDRQLLERFNGRDRDAAELAFAVLVRRHGPMVFRACQSILRDPHAAEDAFQATFLVLARKGPGLWVGRSLGPWLLAVARRTAACARKAEARRREHERRAAGRADRAFEVVYADDRDAILHEELGRLPDAYRTAVVLCDLEGLTQEQAARRLGWPDGTVRSRLARGRERLRARLARRGIGPSTALAGWPTGAESIPASLVETTVGTAVGLAAGGAGPGVSTSALALTEGVLNTMFWGKLRMTAAAVFGCALLCGTGAVGYRAMGRPQVPAPAAGAQPGGPARLDTNVTLPAASGAEPPEVVAVGKARVEAAKKLRDATYRLYESGEISLAEYLTVLTRYGDTIYDAMAKTDADRLQFFERQLAGAKQLEDRVRKLRRGGIVGENDVLAIELYRLDAEYALAKLRAKARRDGR